MSESTLTVTHIGAARRGWEKGVGYDNTETLSNRGRLREMRGNVASDNARGNTRRRKLGQAKSCPANNRMERVKGGSVTVGGEERVEFEGQGRGDSWALKKGELKGVRDRRGDKGSGDGGPPT